MVFLPLEFYLIIVCQFSQDATREDNSILEEVSVNKILEAQNEEQILKQKEEDAKNKARLERGLPPHMPDIGLDDYS